MERRDHLSNPKTLRLESNTRPICLLDTARKIMTRIMNKQLANILSANNVLKGNNYAGLPSSNCSTPIAILKSIIHDTATNNKPLFIFLQDISKAFAVSHETNQDFILLR